MVVICSMDVLVKDGKISNEAKSAIETLEKNDKLIVISKNGSITVNTETLNFLIHVKCPIEVSEYANSNAMLLNVGMELAKATKLKIVMKAEEAAMLKDLLKGNEKVSFGWSEPKKKAKPVEKAPVKEEKETGKVEKKAEKKEEEPVNEPAPRKKRAKKEVAVLEEPKAEETPAKKSKKKADTEVKAELTVADMKKAIGGRYTKKDLETMLSVINEASDSDLGLDFLCKIKLPFLYEQDETFADKMKKAYQKLRG